MAQRSTPEVSPDLLPPPRGEAGSPLATAAGSLAQEPGRPLDGATRTLMQDRFARDFSQVRVHDGARAAASAQALRADAFSLGSHIAFAAGRYAPQSGGGQQLLAHELAHVAQQEHAPATGSLRLGSTGDAAETAADQAASAVGQGLAVPAQSRSEAGVLRRAPCGQYPAGSLLAMRPCTPVSDADINRSSGERELITSVEPLIRNNPKLMRLVAAYRAQAAIHGSAQVQIALPADTKVSSANAAQVGARMFEIQAVLAEQIPLGAISVKPPLGAPRLFEPGRLPRPALNPPGQLSLGIAGQLLAAGGEAIEVAVLQRVAPAPVPLLPRAPAALGPGQFGPLPAPAAPNFLAPAPPAPAASGLSLSGIKFEISFGPLLLKLPKELQLSVERELRGGRKFEFEISYEVPGTGKMKFAVNGNPKVDFAFELSSETDTGDGTTRGGFGLKLSSAKKICHAKSISESLRLANAAALKVNKAAIELQTLLVDGPERKIVPAGPDGSGVVAMPLTPEQIAAHAADKERKAPDDFAIAAKLGEIAAGIKEALDAAEGAKKKCSEVSRWEGGIYGEYPLYRGKDHDPVKDPQPGELMFKLKFHF